MVIASDVYCVRPRQLQDCGHTSHLCRDLQFYASNASQYFASDATLEFLPGEHILQGMNVSVMNVSNLVLTGESVQCAPPSSNSTEPHISCSGEAGFIFQDMVNLTLSSLSFVHCGQPVPPPEFGIARAALGFSSVRNMLLQSLTILNSSGYGIFTINIYGKSMVSGCHLQFNRGGVEYKGGNGHFKYSDCPMQQTQVGIELTVNHSYFGCGGYVGAYNDSKSAGTFATGVSLTMSCTNITFVMHNVTLEDNDNNHGLGNMFVHFYNNTGYMSNTVHISSSRFLRGNSWVGGGLGVTLYIGGSKREVNYVDATDVDVNCKNTLTIDNSVLNENRAITGSGLYVEYLQELSSNNCTANIIIKNSALSNNIVSMKKNQVSITNVGVAIAVLNWQLSGGSIVDPNTFSVQFDNITVEYNTQFIPDYQRLASGSAALFIEDLRGHLEIRDSYFQHNNVTAISAFRSDVKFVGETMILNNTGVRGGGLIVCESSHILFAPNTTISFIRNHAQLSGGGVYAEGQCANSAPLCFFQLDINHGCGKPNISISQLVEDCGIRVNMTDNTANYSGSHIYGGSVGRCFLHGHIERTLSRDEFDAFFKIEGPSTDLSTISSDPRMVCFCHDGETPEFNCSQESTSYADKVYPGETVTISMIITGQLNGAVPGLLRANASSTSTQEYSIHDTGRTCTAIQFPAFSCDYSSATYEFGVFFHSSNFSPNFIIGQSKYMHVAFQQCPSGYELDEVKCKCNCHKTWDRIQCDFEKMILTRSPPAWLGFVDGQIVYEGECPRDYCKEGHVELEIVNGTFDPDQQCSPNRSGVLCGKCKPGFSLSATSSACLDCTHHPGLHLAVYIVGNLLFGLGLVILLTLCNLTITSGMISGLLFYANIFQMNSSVFAPHQFNVLTAILSWVNLDFQLMQCLYNGLDSCTKSWLEFVFPVYLWTIVVAIVLLSRRFSRIALLFAGNTVQVLATLIELSYAGLARAVVTALSPIWITVHSSNQTTYSVRWLYDGNILLCPESKCNI